MKVEYYIVDIWVGVPRWKVVDSFHVSTFKEALKVIKKEKLLSELQGYETKISHITWKKNDIIK